MLVSYISPILTYMQSCIQPGAHNNQVLAANERRHYGALQGYNKDIAFEELNIDQELVMECVGVMQRVLLA